MRESITADKSLDFAVRIVNVSKYLMNENKEYILSKQLLRRTDYLNEKQYESLNKDVQEIISLLTASCKTANQNK